MSRKLAELLLLAVRTDTEAVLVDGVWLTRCLHCRSKLWLRSDGQTLNGATLEHVVPISWFEKRAAQELTRSLQGPNDERNLALSCPRCNQSKGSRHDSKGPNHVRAREVVENLRASRMNRYRPLTATEPTTTGQ